MGISLKKIASAVAAPVQQAAKKVESAASSAGSQVASAANRTSRVVKRGAGQVSTFAKRNPATVLAVATGGATLLDRYGAGPFAGLQQKNPQLASLLASTPLGQKYLAAAGQVQKGGEVPVGFAELEAQAFAEVGAGDPSLYGTSLASPLRRVPWWGWVLIGLGALVVLGGGAFLAFRRR